MINVRRSSKRIIVNQRNEDARRPIRVPHINLRRVVFGYYIAWIGTVALQKPLTVPDFLTAAN